MSERYGSCKQCNGQGRYIAKNSSGELGYQECPTCQGTGFDGDAMTKLQKEMDADQDRDIISGMSKLE